MPINISNITNNTSQTSRTDEQKHSKSVQNSEGRADQSPKATLEQDSVNLTNSAMRIKSLEEQVARLPIVDTQKVEQIRNSITDGTFEFNSDRIAEKLINFEKNLF
ncbi:MAG: flagellar biosynthesis anti-sigma factor FlgM [Gammaproteobacteria bacterium]|nr:flagellar biosynthesis anti-sigma factor FlgM [Gammaproteobacteria bacterium]